jgi:fatty acid desaturase
MSDEARKTFLYQLLSKVDIFWIWWLAVYSIGLAVIYKMKTQKMAMAVAAVYLIYAVAAAALTALFS